MIISVASGKGGTGKTMVATSLAISIDEKVGLQFADMDVEEPNAALFLKPGLGSKVNVSVPIPKVEAARCTYCRKCAEVCAFNAIVVLPDEVMVFPELCHGCGACSYLCPQEAISEVGKDIGTIERGSVKNFEYIQGRLNVGEAMATPVIREIKKLLYQDKLTILDAPPGTSCPVLETVTGSDFCLLVTEPTPFGLNDLKLAVEMVRKLNIPCGVIVNRDWGIGIIDEYCLQQNIPVLLRIPLDLEIAKLYSKGITLSEGKPEWRPRFRSVIDKIERITGSRKKLTELAPKGDNL